MPIKIYNLTISRETIPVESINSVQSYSISGAPVVNFKINTTSNVIKDLEDACMRNEGCISMLSSIERNKYEGEIERLNQELSELSIRNAIQKQHLEKFKNVCEDIFGDIVGDEY